MIEERGGYPVSVHFYPLMEGESTGVRFFLRNLRVSWQLLSAYWQSALAYRGIILMRGFHTIMMPTILLLTWLSVKKQPHVNYSDQDYFLYFLLMPFIMNITQSFTVYDFPGEVRDGTLSRNLLKPVHPLWLHVIKNITHKILLLLHVIPVLAIMCWFCRDQLPPVDLSFSRLSATSAVLILGIILRFVMTTSIALTGFWIEHVETLSLVFNQAIWAIFGGMVLPVETMPPLMKMVAILLPYRYSLSFPLEILRGKLSFQEALLGLGVSCGWCLLFFWLMKLLWRRGLKLYTAYGG